MSSFCRIGSVVSLALLSALPVSAQEYELRSESWFPLHVGSYWHYTSRGSEGVTITSEWINATVADSVFDGRRWTLMRTIRCLYGPDCPLGVNAWYSFSEDDYLLRSSRGFEFEPDTVLSTMPVSVFSVTSSSDTLSSWMAGPDYPVVVSISTDDAGNEADSTHLILRVHAHVFFSGSFVYKIGRADGLIGALVDGLAYGDTTQIRSVVLSAGQSPDTGDLELDAYPNPFSSILVLEVRAEHSGWHELSIYDVVGRRIHRETRWLHGLQSSRINWVIGGSRPSGTYFVILEDGEGRRVRSSAVLIN